MIARAAPSSAFAAALVCSAGILASLPALLIGAGIDQRFARPFVLGACGAASAAFGYGWPGPAWRWGVWLSAALWLFFGGVFAALLANGIPEWLPLLDAAASLATGCVGAALGSRLGHARATSSA